MIVDRRIKFRQGLSTLFLPYYDALCDELPKQWQPYQGVRTFEEQDRLWRQGRQTSGSVVTNAKGGESAHCYGCATDWTLWSLNDMPIWMPANDPRWRVFVEAAERVGLRSGVEFHDIDHVELKISCSWKHILIAYNANGMTAAQQKIESSIIKENSNGPKGTVA